MTKFFFYTERRSVNEGALIDIYQTDNGKCCRHGLQFLNVKRTNMKIEKAL